MAKVICSTCHHEIEDTLSVCNYCGCPVVAAATGKPATTMQTPSALNKPKKKGTTIGKIIISAIGILNGIISIVFGVVIAVARSGNFTYSSQYGGDAYTGIQNAAADTANNVAILINDVKLFGSFLLIVLGLFIVITFAFRLISALEKESKKQ